MVSGSDILQYIPQRAPMVMVDRLYSASTLAAETGFCPAPENIFVTDGVFQEPGIVEHIAQSAALQAGYQYISAGLAVPIGYIAAIKDLVIHFLPASGIKLTTRLEVVNKIMGVTLVKGVVSAGGKEVASCEMRIFIRE